MVSNGFTTQNRSVSTPTDCLESSALKRPEVILYTRSGCHLCDVAEEILVKHGLSPQTVDIDLNSRLLEQYNDCVPVVVMDGQVRFRGRVNSVLLKRLLNEPKP